MYLNDGMITSNRTINLGLNSLAFNSDTTGLVNQFSV